MKKKRTIMPFRQTGAICINLGHWSRLPLTLLASRMSVLMVLLIGIVPPTVSGATFRTMTSDPAVVVIEEGGAYNVSATYGSAYASRTMSVFDSTGAFRTGISLYSSQRTGVSWMRNVRIRTLRVNGQFGAVDRIEGLDDDGIPALSGTISRSVLIPGHPVHTVETEFVAYAPFSELYRIETAGTFRAMEAKHFRETYDLWLHCSQAHNAWTISSAVDWITINEESQGVGNSRIRITVHANTGTEPRQGLLRVSTDTRVTGGIMRVTRGFLVYQDTAPAATPVFEPDGGYFSGDTVEVTVTGATPDTLIYYTLDGSTPTEYSPIVESGNIVSVWLPGTLTAVAIHTTMRPSAIRNAAYHAVPTVAVPVFDPDGGDFLSDTLTVTVTCDTEGASIHYSVDGSEPTESSDSVAPGETISVPVPGTLTARAFKDGMAPSAIVAADYAAVVFAEPPEFDPDGGTFLGDHTPVQLNCATPGAVIRYTLDGVEPTAADSAAVPGETVPVPLPALLKARAFAEGMHPSVVATAQFEAAPFVAAPQIQPGSGEFDAALMLVEIDCDTPGAIIRYTLDGSEPTLESEVLPPSGQVLLPLPSELRARAWSETMNPSPVQTASFTRQPVSPLSVLVAGDPTESALLGDSLAVDNGLIVAGAPWHGDDPFSGSAGSVYVFDAQTHETLYKLLPPDGSADGWFGKSVDIRDNRVLVGAWDILDEDGVGAAHLYEADTGRYLRRLTPADGGMEGLGFGFSVALGDGVAAVGAPDGGSGSGSFGRVLLFSLDDGAQLFHLMLPDGAGNDQFGFSLAIEDGILAVGTHGRDAVGRSSGAVYLYDTATGELLRTLLPDEGSANHYFGWSLAGSGGKLLVGAIQDASVRSLGGGAYVFDIRTGELLHRLFPVDPGDTIFFGLSVAARGDYALVGAIGSSAPGAFNRTGGCAYLFNLRSGDYLAKLLSQTGEWDSDFGRAIAIEGTTGYIADRAASFDLRGEGAVYVYDLTAVVQSQPRSFSQWLSDEGLAGDPIERLREICPQSGMPRGFRYTFGSSLPPERPLLNIRMVNGRPVVETPRQNILTMPFIDVRVIGSTNLTDWTLPIRPAQDISGKPADTDWHEPDGPPLDKAFFRLEAELK